jgi:hypothetical protein
MTELPVSAALEPRRISGGAAGARARGQWVRYPLRMVLDAEAYADADLKVYGKVKALSRNRPCTASVDKIAGYVGLAPSTAEKSLGRLSRPAPTDGVTELTRRQRSHKGTGTGRTTERTCRDLGPGERYVDAPVLAADTLRGTLHRLYLLLRYTTVVDKRQLTLAEMAWALRHRTGKLAGKALAEAAVSKLLDELAEAGWITLDRRAGYRGRHLVTVHDDPLHPVDQEQATADPQGGAAPDHGGGALAYKEDQELNDRGNNPPTAVWGIRRRRPTPASARDERGLALDTFGRRPGLHLTPHAWTTVRGVLQPVRHELEALTGWEWERLVGAVLAQLNDGQSAERLHDRLERRYARMRPPGSPDDGRPAIDSLARWLLGPALTRKGCQDPACESGLIWRTGTDCPVCDYTRQTAAARAQRLLDDHTADRRRPADVDAHRPRRSPARRPRQQQPEPPGPPPAATPPTGSVGPPPGAGGWRALVARERPQAAAHAYRHRWTGDHAHHLTDTA